MHHLDIKAAVCKKYGRLYRYGEKFGCTGNAIGQIIRGESRSDRIEADIALNVIGRPLHEVFPSRYPAPVELIGA